MGELLKFDPIADNEQYTPEERVFWFMNDKGVCCINDGDFIAFLNNRGFWLYYPVKSPDNYKFVHVKNNVISTVDTRDIKEVAVKFAKGLGDVRAVNTIIKKTAMFSDKYLNALPVLNPKIIKDTVSLSYIPVPKGVYKVNKDKIEFIEYSQLKDGYVWETQICNRNYNYLTEQPLKGDFYQFCENLADGSSEALHSTIGYLLHNYKSPSNSKAVILYDKNLIFESGEPEGGSGKSLIATAIEKIREVAPISGDRVDFSKSFVFQELNESTQVAWVDELDPKADMSKFFSRITNGIPVEKKNKDVLYIRPEDSPKFVFTTNFKPSGSSGSHRRRRIEFAVSNHYNADHTPRDEFKRDFFNGWGENDIEWDYFFTFFLECLRGYLKNGIVKQSDNGSEFVACAAEVGADFARFAFSKQFECIINKPAVNARSLYVEFLSENDLEQKDFSLKRYFASLRKVCTLRSLNLHIEGNSINKTIEIHDDQNQRQGEFF